MRPNNFESAALDIFKSGIKNSDDLSCAKRKTSKKEKIKMSSNVELLKVYHKLVKNKRLKPSANLELILRKKKIRSLSDIVNVSVLTKLFCIQNSLVRTETFTMSERDRIFFFLKISSKFALGFNLLFLTNL